MEKEPDVLNEQQLAAYTKDKLDQYECMGEYVAQNGYSWSRRDSIMGSDGMGGEMEVAYKFHTDFLDPPLVRELIIKTKWHLVRELKDVGVNLYKGYPPPQPY